MVASSEITQPGESIGVFFPFSLCCIVVAAILASAAVPDLWHRGFFAEGGPLEVASVLPYVIGAAGFLLIWPSRALGDAWHVTLLFLLFAARELDWDKSFTAEGVLQASLYSGDHPISQKIIGGLIIFATLAMIYRFVRHGTGPLLRGLRAGELWAWAGSSAFLFAVATKSIDGIGRKLAPYGVELSPMVEAAFAQAEESGELVLSVLLVLSLSAWMALKQRS